MRHQTHEKVVMGRRRPGGVRPPFFEFSELENSLGLGRDEGIEPATVENDCNKIVAFSLRHRDSE
jgi:hypothetical protein